MKLEQQLKALWAEAFADEAAVIDAFFATAYTPQRCMYILEDGKLLSAAYWLDCAYPGGKLAYIYAVATKQEARGRGLCHRLMADIHKTLAAQDYAGAVLVPGEPRLSKLYGTMGYARFGGIEEMTVPAAQPEALQRLSVEAYQTLRQQYLPVGGITQAGDSLRYLERMGVGFAAGTDFLLAYTMENRQLWGLELLGNAQKAPGIVAALGAEAGRFRIPGQTPFAMFKPLQDVPAPTYLGFALD